MTPADVPAPQPATPAAAAGENSGTPVSGTVISPAETPLSVPAARTLALVNLILTIATVLVMIMLLATYFRNRGSEEKSARPAPRILVTAMAAAAVILFLSTQSLSGQILAYDRWTVWHAAIFAIAAAIAAFSCFSANKRKISRIRQQ